MINTIHDGQVVETDYMGRRTHSLIEFTNPEGGEKFKRVVANGLLEAIGAHWVGARVRNTISCSGGEKTSTLSPLPPTEEDLRMPVHQEEDFSAFRDLGR